MEKCRTASLTLNYSAPLVPSVSPRIVLQSDTACCVQLGLPVFVFMRVTVQRRRYAPLQAIEKKLNFLGCVAPEERSQLTEAFDGGLPQAFAVVVWNAIASSGIILKRVPQQVLDFALVDARFRCFDFVANREEKAINAQSP